jgi:acetylornithine deacetylase/succinyl-diaminopimelate desuccinylase-like protein
MTVEPETRETGVAEREAVDMARDLIRIDTTNTGESETTAGEQAAAEYVAARLADVGLEPVILTSAKGRANVVARLAGTDPGAPALVLHGHLDVVPADPSEWSVHPLSGELRDGYLWGRGAVDMKDMVAMILATVRRWVRRGQRPRRDLVLAFFADEESGGNLGARWMARNHPDLFEGCTEAIGEVGGFSVPLENAPPGARRLYLIETAEKGMSWLRLSARGTVGHGAMTHPDNPVIRVAAAASRIGQHPFPLILTDAVRELLTQVADELGTSFDPGLAEDLVHRLGPVSRLIAATLRDTANVTVLRAGSKINIVPAEAEALIDARALPGREEAFERQLTELAGPDVDLEWLVRLPGLQTPFEGDLCDAMTAALRAEDPDALPVPYLLPAATDAKALATLGIRCFGFAPLRLPDDLDFSALFHGVDERVPVDALGFGVRVLDRLLDLC